MMKLDVSAYPDVVNETKAMSKIDLKAYPAVLNYVKQMSERPSKTWVNLQSLILFAVVSHG